MKTKQTNRNTTTISLNAIGIDPTPPTINRTPTPQIISK